MSYSFACCSNSLQKNARFVVNATDSVRAIAVPFFNGNFAACRRRSMKSDFNPETVAEMSAYVAEVVSAIHQGVQVPEEDLNNLQTILDFLNGLDTTGTGAHIREGIAQGMTEAGFDSDAETVATNLETALNTVLQIESPSKRVKPTGEHVAAGVGEGMSGYDFSADAQDTASGIESALQTALTGESLKNAGTAAAQGLGSTIAAYGQVLCLPRPWIWWIVRWGAFSPTRKHWITTGGINSGRR